MTGRAPFSLAARLLLAVIALTLFWAPLSHAGPCDHEAGANAASVTAAEPSAEPAAPGEAGDPAGGAHICSCTGCHFHILVQSGLRPVVAAPSRQLWLDLAARSPPAAQSGLFRPPRI